MPPQEVKKLKYKLPRILPMTSSSEWNIERTFYLREEAIKTIKLFLEDLKEYLEFSNYEVEIEEEVE